MKKLLLTIMLFGLFFIDNPRAQDKRDLQEEALQLVMEKTNVEALQILVEIQTTKYEKERAQAVEWAKKNGMPIDITYPDGTIISIQKASSQCYHRRRSR